MSKKVPFTKTIQGADWNLVGQQLQLSGQDQSPMHQMLEGFSRVGVDPRSQIKGVEEKLTLVERHRMAQVRPSRATRDVCCHFPPARKKCTVTVTEVLANGNIDESLDVKIVVSLPVVKKPAERPKKSCESRTGAAVSRCGS